MVILLVALAACSGTTEARHNDDLEPGSGNLGPGDVPTTEPESGVVVGDSDDGTVAGSEEGENGMGSIPPNMIGPVCGSEDATAAIGALIDLLYVDNRTAADRAAAVQLGDDPDVVERLAAMSARETERWGDVDSASVARIDCLDDGSAALRVTVRYEQRTLRRDGSAMLVDGSWRVTLHALCEWAAPSATCAAVPGLRERALDALSPSLRARLAP